MPQSSFTPVSSCISSIPALNGSSISFTSWCQSQCACASSSAADRSDDEVEAVVVGAAAKEAVYDARLRGAAPQHFGGYWDDPEVVPYGGYPSGAPDDGGYADGYYEPDDGY